MRMDMSMSYDGDLYDTDVDMLDQNDDDSEEDNAPMRPQFQLNLDFQRGNSHLDFEADAIPIIETSSDMKTTNSGGKTSGRLQGMGLGLNLNLIQNMNDSFQISNSGIFNSENISISSKGLRIDADSNGRNSARSHNGDTPSNRDSDQPNSARSVTSPSGSQIFNVSRKDLVDLGAIGQGVSGLVKKCFHSPTLSLVAVKCISVWDKAKRHQMIRELHAFETNTQCPHIVGFLGAFYEEGTTKLCLEFANRGSIQSVIESYGAIKNEQVLASLSAQALLGLQALHATRTVHRDIKPANILVNHMGIVQITDFGIVAELQTDSNCNTFVGTAVYMSPERLQSKPYSYASDIWSLGMSVITAALGQFPISLASGGYWKLTSMICDETPPTLPDSFSPQCRSFLAQCLVKDPAQRGTIAELLKHPFVAGIAHALQGDLADKKNMIHQIKWPFHGKPVRQKTYNDMSQILDFVVVQDIASGRTYNRSLMDLARFGRIADQLTIPVNEVQAQYESKLSAAVQQQ